MTFVDVKKKWFDLCSRICGSEKICNDSWNELVSAYSSPNRHYHTLEGHIAKGLLSLEELRLHKVPHNFNALQFAWFFHDSIFDPNSKDNEIRSADFAERIARKMGLTQEFIDVVRDLIIVTHRSIISQDLDESLIVDIDIENFGWNFDDFKNQTNLIRKEIPDVSDEEFSKSTNHLFDKTLKKGSIFLTPFFKNKYESSAKKNLSKALSHQK